MARYDVALVCMNGHGVNQSATKRPELNSKYCSECGEATIFQCPSCNTQIRGRFESEYGGWGWDRPPSHCHECGKPYPWTQRQAEAVTEALDELDALGDQERDKLKKSIPDILVDTPKSQTAVLRFKKAAAKVGTVGGKVLMDVLAKVAAETVKKSLGL